MKDLVIVGAGGHAREMHQSILAMNRVVPTWNFLGFVDDFAKASEVAGCPVFRGGDWLRGKTCSVVIAIGSPAIRYRVAKELEAQGPVEFATLIHPSSQIGDSVVLEPGCMVSAGVILTADIKVGRHVIINTGAVVSHDCRIDDFCTIAPMSCLCGAVRLGEGAELGAGVTIIPGVSVGDWSMTGAGTTVIRDVAANETVVGGANRVINKQNAGWHQKV